MSRYVGVARDRIIQLGTAAVAGVPARTDIPHIVLSPRTSRGQLTQGFAFELVAPSAGAAVATAPGFTITIYRAIPTLGSWGALQAFTGANFLDQLVLPDISGGIALYFQITSVTTPGNVLLGVGELD